MAMMPAKGDDLEKAEPVQGVPVYYPYGTFQGQGSHDGQASLDGQGSYQGYPTIQGQQSYQGPVNYQGTSNYSRQPGNHYSTIYHNHQYPLEESPLPFCNLGFGWLLFILGFLFLLPWYVGAVIFFCGPHDSRERTGLTACTIAAIIFLMAGGTTKFSGRW